MKSRTLILIALILFAGCAKKTAVEPKNLDYEFAGISTGIPTFNSFKLYTDIKLTNVNGFYVDVQKIGYKLFVDNELIAEGVNDEPIGLKKNEAKYCKLKVLINFGQIKENLLEAIKERNADIRIEGETVMMVGKQEYVFPFELEKSIQK